MKLFLLCTLLFSTPGNDAQTAVTPTVVRLLDLDGDGHPDKLYLGADGSMRVALHAGGRRFDEIAQALPRVSVSSVLVTDLDGDGSLDLFLIGSHANVALRGDGTGRFYVATAELGLEDAGEGLSAERVDLDEDGHADLLLHNQREDIVYWSNGNGTFERDTQALPRPVRALTAAPPVSVGRAAPADEAAPTPMGTSVERSSRTTSSLSPPGASTATALTVLSFVTGTGTPGMLPMWVGPRRLGDSILVESAGDLGIGTSSPAARLDVAGDMAINGTQVIDSAGQWVGDPTGLVGPTGPPGAVPASTDSTGSGTVVNNMQPFLALSYIIVIDSVNATYPSRGGSSVATTGPLLGEIKLFAGSFIPGGYAFCDGQLMAISTNGVLFSLLGTSYGGDGETTFALPDLRGRVPMHSGTGPGLSSRSVGAMGGSEGNILTISELAAHTHGITPP